MWSFRGDANAKACFGFVAPSVIDLRNRAQQQQVLRSVYRGIGWEVPRLLGMMPGTPDYYFDAAAQIRMDHWSQGRVVLVGDAGYCASPMSGQGTSLALIGAYVLAGELVAASGADQTAFQQYEKEMRPCANKPHFWRIGIELGWAAEAPPCLRSDKEIGAVSRLGGR